MAAQATLHLTKHHGAGNDFLVLLDPEGRQPLTPAEVVALCRRRTGIGADGLVRVMAGSARADLVMELHNADGSPAEMSGNGIRCLVQAAVVGGLVGPGPVSVLTGAGVRTVDYRVGAQPGVGYGAVDMGTASLGEELGPGDLAAALAAVSDTAVADQARWLAGELGGARHIRRVDMGNPHLVLLGEVELAGRIAQLGPVLSGSTAQGANVELVWPGPEPGALSLRVWERGVGETLACGTGTCAAAAAARSWGEVGERVAVHNPGGTLEVTLGADTVTLAGPTVLVADVTVDATVLAAVVAAGRSDLEPVPPGPQIEPAVTGPAGEPGPDRDAQALEPRR